MELGEESVEESQVGAAEGGGRGWGGHRGAGVQVGGGVLGGGVFPEMGGGGGTCENFRQTGEGASCGGGKKGRLGLPPGRDRELNKKTLAVNKTPGKWRETLWGGGEKEGKPVEKGNSFCLRAGKKKEPVGELGGGPKGHGSKKVAHSKRGELGGCTNRVRGEKVFGGRKLIVIAQTTGCQKGHLPQSKKGLWARGVEEGEKVAILGFFFVDVSHPYGVSF